ncbi:hypothetical protein ACWF9G_32870 [Nocardia sp. NPDC055029]
MTKRSELIKKIAEAARTGDVTWELAREGGNHSVFKLGGKQIPIGRHAEIDDRLAVTIYKQCEEVLGKGWWRK